MTTTGLFKMGFPLAKVIGLVLVLALGVMMYRVQWLAVKVTEVKVPRVRDNVTEASNVTVTAMVNGSRAAGTKNRFLIYWCNARCGGWADRLKGIVIAYVIANLTQRQFGIRIPDIPCPLSQFLLPADEPWELPDLMNMTSGAKTYDLMDSRQFYKKVASMDFGRFFGGRVALFKANLDYFNQLKLNKRYEAQLSWMHSLTNDQIFARIFRRLFRLGPRVEKALRPVLTSALPSDKHRLLCAHVRFASNSGLVRDSVRRHTMQHGDTVLRFLRSLDPASPHYNHTAATAALPLSPTPIPAANYRFFVTSDSPVFMDKAEREIGQRFVRTGGQVVHVDRKGGKGGEEACEGFTKVVADQQLLTHCHVLVVSLSGLSRQAAYLRDTDHGLYCLLMTGRLQHCQRQHLRQLYGVLG